MIKAENIQSIDHSTKYTLHPHIHGQWKVIRTSYETIDVTCKDSPIKPEIFYNEYNKGSLSECDRLIQASK